MMRLVLALSFGIALFTGGCIAPKRVYESNSELLAQIAGDLGLDLSGADFEVVRGEVREDAVLLYFRSLKNKGDQAWIWRFSQKSSEQRPDQLRDIDSLTPVLAKHRQEFVASDVHSASHGTAQLRYMTYRFDSPVRKQDGRPALGKGVFGIVEAKRRGEPVVYYVNLDNWGDRDDVDLGALEPFLDAIVDAEH